MATKVSIVLHEGDEAEMRAASYLETSPKKAGITKSQYVAKCIIAAEEGGLLTISMAQLKELLEGYSPTETTRYNEDKEFTL